MRKKHVKYITALLLVFMILKPVQANAKEEQPPRMVDRADILTDDEEAELRARLDTISQERECDVVIVTVNALEGKTPEAYADDFYDENRYGAGRQDADGILLLISMEDRDWAISTRGFGITAFTDAGQEYMAEQFLPYLSDGDYAWAFEEFADLCDAFIIQADTGEPYDIGNMPEESYKELFPIWAAFSFGVGFVVMFSIAVVRKSGLKSVQGKDTARHYTKKGSLELEVKKDLFVRQYVTKRKIETESESGGSSTHISSSGETHGGSSGKF